MMAALLLSHPFIPVTILHVTSNLRLCRMTVSLILDQRSWKKYKQKNISAYVSCLLFPALKRGWCRGIRWQPCPSSSSETWDTKTCYRVSGEVWEPNPLLLDWCKDVRGDTWWAQVCCRGELEAGGELRCGTVGCTELACWSGVWK